MGELRGGSLPAEPRPFQSAGENDPIAARAAGPRSGRVGVDLSQRLLRDLRSRRGARQGSDRLHLLDVTERLQRPQVLLGEGGFRQRGVGHEVAGDEAPGQGHQGLGFLDRVENVASLLGVDR
jgi:hypothetical protein